jgi:3-deoxy-7-phosphoheptulonate synthase
VLYSRLGAKRVKELLPPMIKAVREAGCTAVCWCCDPMHGNTTTTAGGIKTRAFDDIVGELMATIEVHADAGGRLGGIHFELTGEPVTECTGGANEITELDLGKRFESACDPRLNYSQSMEVAFLVAQHLAKSKLQGSDGK